MANPVMVNPSPELCLDFSNTVDWRNAQKRDDKLKGFASLVSWGVEKGIIPSEERASLIRSAKVESLEEDTMRKAVLLRETIYRIFSAVAHEKHPSEEDVRILNEFISGYSVSSRIVRTGNEYQWAWVPEKGMEGRMLWPIAKSAADLLTSDQLARVTECANEEEGCGWVFLDKTRSRTRRWCSMSGCGNRAKARAWYVRHEKAE